MPACGLRAPESRVRRRCKLTWLLVGRDKGAVWGDTGAACRRRAHTDPACAASGGRGPPRSPRARRPLALRRFRARPALTGASRPRSGRRSLGCWRLALCLFCWLQRRRGGFTSRCDVRKAERTSAKHHGMDQLRGSTQAHGDEAWNGGSRGP